MQWSAASWCAVISKAFMGAKFVKASVVACPAAMGDVVAGMILQPTVDKQIDANFTFIIADPRSSKADIIGRRLSLELQQQVELGTVLPLEFASGRPEPITLYHEEAKKAWAETCFKVLSIDTESELPLSGIRDLR
jgi:hypothetical protein